MWKGNTLSTAYCEALRSHCFLCALTLGLMAPPHSRFNKDTAHAVPTCFTLTFRQVRCTLLCREPAVARALELQCILGSSHYMSFSPPQGKNQKEGHKLVAGKRNNKRCRMSSRSCVWDSHRHDPRLCAHKQPCKHSL